MSSEKKDDKKGNNTNEKIDQKNYSKKRKKYKMN